MITTAEATQAVLGAMSPFDSINVPLDEAPGRILRQTVVAERDQPPFDRVTMDGIAIRFEAFANGRREFQVQATQYAGDQAVTLRADTDCVEIMTGAVLPKGTNCIIPVERTTSAEGVAIVENDYAPEPMQFVHAQGSDYAIGHEILQPGRQIAPAHVAIIASCGLDTVEVSTTPSVAIVSTGNELVPAGQSIEPHQIRMSNGPALVAMLSQHGFDDVEHSHLPDELDVLSSKLARLLDTANVLVLSGGVSMGKADFVPQVLNDLGVRLVFHKISQRPGKPMWFGIGPNGQSVFALPGNPVSALVCCRQYVIPALFHASVRAQAETILVALGEEFSFRAPLTCFLPVRIQQANTDRREVVPVATNTSGDFSALGSTDGYVELAREVTLFSKGQIVPFHPWQYGAI